VFVLQGKEKPVQATGENKTSPMQAQDKNKGKKQPAKRKRIGWWNSMKLSRKIASGYLVVILLVFALAGFSYQRDHHNY
jgi:hypothetical protein